MKISKLSSMTHIYKNVLLKEIKYELKPKYINGNKVSYLDYTRKLKITKDISIWTRGYATDDNIFYLVGADGKIAFDIISEDLVKHLLFYLESDGDNKVEYNGNDLYYDESKTIISYPPCYHLLDTRYPPHLIKNEDGSYVEVFYVEEIGPDRIYKDSLLRDIEYEVYPSDFNSDQVIYFDKNISRELNITEKITISTIGYIIYSNGDFDHLYLIGPNGEIVFDIISEEIIDYLTLYLESKGENKVYYRGNYLYYTTSFKDTVSGEYYIFDNIGDPIMDKNNDFITLYYIDIDNEIKIPPPTPTQQPQNNIPTKPQTNSKFQKDKDVPKFRLIITNPMNIKFNLNGGIFIKPTNQTMPKFTLIPTPKIDIKYEFIDGIKMTPASITPTTPTFSIIKTQPIDVKFDFIDGIKMTPAIIAPTPTPKFTLIPTPKIYIKYEFIDGIKMTPASIAPTTTPKFSIIKTQPIDVKFKFTDGIQMTSAIIAMTSIFKLIKPSEIDVKFELVDNVQIKSS
jgi:hypothetical protein